MVPEGAPGSAAFSALKTLTHSWGGGNLYFLLQMKQGGNRMGVGKGREGIGPIYKGLGVSLRWEGGSWGQGGGALAEP